MKLMTYNILDGGQDRLPLLIDIIKQENPDYLTLNEANDFDKNDQKIIKDVAAQTGFPYFQLALSGEYDYHVAVFSKFPFKKMDLLRPLMRACVVSVIDTPLGEISIASLHLTPYTEDLRHPEIDLILDFQKEYPNRILMGDMNSLSKFDNYSSSMLNTFNEIQLKKFATNGTLRFDVIDKVMSKGYYDVALEMHKNSEITAPTPTNKDKAHSMMRLDYIFVSENLKQHIQSYEVVKNELTDKASDHYPITVILK